MASDRQRRKSMELPPDFSLSGISSEPEEQPPQPLSLNEPDLIHTTSVSSRYKDIISKSSQIHLGRPAVYQLRAKKQQFGTLSRMTVGERNPNKSNKTILLVGETGAGKSTLVNVLLNYSMGVKWEDEVWFQIVEEERSQTSDVIMYEIFGYEDQTLPYSLTIIDTPGFGDTRGTKHDDIISQRLLDLFGSEDGVHEVHAVGLVKKAESMHQSDRLLYIFDSVTSLFGKGLEKNTVALITHSDGRRPKNALKALDAKIKCAKNEKNQPVYFLFNNCQDEDRTEDEEKDLQRIYETSEQGMKQFTAFLRKTKPLKPEASPEVLKECFRLTACIQNLQERIKFIEVKQREMKQTREALKKEERGITGSVAEVYKDKEALRGGKCVPGLEAALSCTVCEENCHYPGCREALTHCEVFRDGRCTACTRKCPPSSHVKEKWRYVTRMRKIKGERENWNKLSLLKNLEKEIKQLTAEKKQLLEESYQHVGKLEITLNLPAHSESTYVHLDFLIEKMKEEGDTEKVQKLEEIRSRVDEGARAALQPTLSLISSPYEDIILNSFLIHSGRPAVYQLRPKKLQFGTLSRMTVGEKNVNKINKTILLVGETGAGKSTLVNALINYSMGVKFEDEVWFQIVEEEKQSQAESQTSDVIVYEIFGYEDQTLPYSLTIIDTPGFGDTRGTEHDDIISQRLLDLFRSDDGVAEIHAVGLVMKAAENRLSDRLMYVFNSVMSLFGKNMEKQIVALITHSNGVTPKNALKALEAAKIKCAKNKKKHPVHFLFDNCQQTERTEANKAKFKSSWDITQTGMGHLTEFLGKSGSQKLMTTLEVLNERIRLKACIQNLKERINLTELKQTKIRQTEEALKKHEEEMKKNQNFIVEIDEGYKVKELIDGGRWGRWWGWLFYEAAVCCTVCEENCHYPGCTMARKPEHCLVMRGGRCTVCTKKCPASAHVKEKKKYVTKTRKVKMTDKDVKEKYEKSKEARDDKLSLLENLKQEMKELTAEKKKLLDESYQHVIKLEQIALNVDSVSTIVLLDFLIEKMKEEGDTEKVHKLEEMRSREDERVRAAHWYKLAQIPSAIKNMGKSFH